MARSMVSPGMLSFFAASTAVRSRGFALMSPPPRRAATVISLMSLVKILPRLESFAAFLCLIVLHFEWPDMANASGSERPVRLPQGGTGGQPRYLARRRPRDDNPRPWGGGGVRRYA